MIISKSFGVLALLVALTAAVPCTYEGVTRENLAVFPHENGCAQIQCQFGKPVIYYEACGKEIDGKCNGLNMMFVYQGDTYLCSKTLVEDDYQYVNQIVVRKKKNCVLEGGNYQHLQKFKSAASCQDYQCQDGQIFPIDEGCGGSIDGKCHLVGEHFVVNGVTYNCTARDENGYTIFEYKTITTSKNTQACKAANNTYSHLEIFSIPGNCNKRQCYNRQIRILTYGCLFKQDKDKCYSEGEEWTFNDQSYSCVRNPTGGTRIVTGKVYAKCKRSERIYNHLEIHTGEDGCYSVQCQDGKTPSVDGGCFSSADGTCKKLNFVWSIGTRNYKCYLNNEGLFRIAPVDENGKVIEVPAPTLAPPVFKETCPELAADIIFVWDASQSMSRFNFMRQLNFSCDIVSAFRIGPNNVQVGGVVFSDTSEKVFDLNTYKDFDSICKAIHAVPYLSDITETHKAFQTIVSEGMFTSAAGGRPNVPKICIVITDGASTNTNTTLAAANQVKALGVQMIAVGVGAVSEPELRGIASHPKNVFTINNYDAIFSIRQELADRTCNVSTDPIVPPEETKPPLCPETVADVIFVIDSSSETGDKNYKTQLDLAANVSKIFSISPEHVQVGAVLISSQPTKLFDLNTYSDKASVSKAITNAAYLKGDRELDDAIDLVLNDGLFTSAHGGRDSAKRVVVILLNGPPTDWAKSLPRTKKLRNEGLHVITIGVGNYPQKKLTGLSGTPENVFTAPTYELLEFTKSLLYNRVCDATTLPRPAPEPPRCTDTENPPCDQICQDTKTGYTCDCNTGFVVNKQNNSKCDDVNECTAKPESCQQICENTIGSYRCLCKPGFVINSRDIAKCTDINECDTNPCHHICTNTDGSYNCSCNSGYTLSANDPSICEDIDECSKNSPCEQKCSNTDGGYECSCETGFIVSPANEDRCEDIDECSRDFPCLHNCENTYGGYICSCKPGYVVSAGAPNNCEDINECIRDSPCDQICTNIDGSYTCSCKPGYVISSTFPDKCDVVDKCGTVSPCEQVCQNVGSEFNCSCRHGYIVNAKNSTKCDDVDECSRNLPCEQLCTNTVGGYVCSCRPGYAINATDPDKCDDVDECSSDSPCEQLCTNIVGSYSCSCRSGYVVSDKDKKKCVDIDECSKDSPCQQICDNAEGGYTCSCREGYVVNTTNPNKCDDVDECSRDVPCQQICTNKDGGYTCSCKPGFEISATDPNKCDEIDLCEDSPCQHICQVESSRFTCSCRSGYTLNKDGIRCDEIDLCGTSSPCEQICTNKEGGVICSCRPGYEVNSEDPTTCEEIDPCETASCEHICQITESGFSCSCRPGYIISSEDPTKCDEIPAPAPGEKSTCGCNDGTVAFVPHNCYCPTRVRYLPGLYNQGLNTTHSQYSLGSDIKN